MVEDCVKVHGISIHGRLFSLLIEPVTAEIWAKYEEYICSCSVMVFLVFSKRPVISRSARSMQSKVGAFDNQ